jgi:hypothetical protein
MLCRATREKMNKCFCKVIIDARHSHGLGIPEAAEFTGFSVTEYLAAETVPSMISLSILSRIMTAFGKEIELAEAANRATFIMFESKSLSRKAPKFPFPQIESIPSNPTQPTH